MEQTTGDNIMAKYYFIFGARPCQEYRRVNNEVKSMDLDSFDNGVLYVYDERLNNPVDLLVHYDGYVDWVRISSDDYLYLSNKLEIKKANNIDITDFEKVN